jgi:hypothetical protein
VIRHPRLVLDSLGRRNNTRFYHFWVHKRFLQAWQVYNWQCLRFHCDNPGRSTLVMLEDMLQGPQAVVADLAEWLGLSLDAGAFQDLYDPRILAGRPAQVRLASPLLYRRCLSLYRRMRRLISGRRPERSGRAETTGQGGDENP